MMLMMWKKNKEIAKAPIKILFLFIMPSLLVLLYLYYFHISFEKIYMILPFITCCLSQVILFNVEEITYIIWYYLIGIKPQKLWISNILYIIIHQYIITEITLLFFSRMLEYHINRDVLFSHIVSLFGAFTFLGLSLLHYSSNSKMEQAIASIFALLNMISPVAIFIFNLPVNMKRTLPVLFFIMLIVNFIVVVYLKKDRSEKLIENIKVYTDGYNGKFFGED